MDNAQYDFRLITVCLVAIKMVKGIPELKFL